MDLNKLIKQQVKKAFKTAGTFAINVQLLLVTTSDFDFATQTAVPNTPQSVTIKGIPLNERSGGRKTTGSSGLTTTLLKTVMFIAEEIGHPDIYDKAIIDGVNWKPVPPFESDGATTTITFARET